MEQSFSLHMYVRIGLNIPRCTKRQVTNRVHMTAITSSTIEAVIVIRVGAVFRDKTERNGPVCILE
jgi:hypothetical protein